MLTLVAAVEVYDFVREIREASSRSRYAMSETREEKDILVCLWFGFTVLWLSASVSLMKQGWRGDQRGEIKRQVFKVNDYTKSSCANKHNGNWIVCTDHEN